MYIYKQLIIKLRVKKNKRNKLISSHQIIIIIIIERIKIINTIFYF